MKIISPLRAGLALVACACLTACGGAAQKYYQLNADGAAPTGTTGLSVGVGPVSLPSYVDRAELVFQSGPNEYQVPADAHWAGGLKENISRVLAEDLGRRLHSGNVLSFPWNPGAKLRYQVAVDVGKFHAISGQGAVLEVSWRVLNSDGSSTIRRGNGAFHEPIVGDGYDAVVTAENNLLAQLADSMAGSLRER